MFWPRFTISTRRVPSQPIPSVAETFVKASCDPVCISDLLEFAKVRGEILTRGKYLVRCSSVLFYRSLGIFIYGWCPSNFVRLMARPTYGRQHSSWAWLGLVDSWNTRIICELRLFSMKNIMIEVRRLTASWDSDFSPNRPPVSVSSVDPEDKPGLSEIYDDYSTYPFEQMTSGTLYRPNSFRRNVFPCDASHRFSWQKPVCRYCMRMAWHGYALSDVI